MRERFKTSRICSSSNYKQSIKARRTFVQRTHNSIEAEKISSEIGVIKKPFTKVFGKLIPLTESEANRLSNSVNIVWL